LQRRFRAVPGVIDVTGWGGKTKDLRTAGRFQQTDRLRVDTAALLQAVSNSNINVGGNTSISGRNPPWCAASD